MRIALLSDIHSHLIALQAVLADLETQAIDQTICLGDICTLGYAPRASLVALQEQHIPIIMGNHDSAILQPEQAARYRIAPHLVDNLHWSRTQLTAEDLAFVAGFTAVHQQIVADGITLLCYHGSPQANTDSLLATTSNEELDQYLVGCDQTILAGGHTHVQMVRQHNGRWLINPGSVGSAFSRPFAAGVEPTLLPWAEYAIVEYAGGIHQVNLRRVPFDIAASMAAIEAANPPGKAWWLEQYAAFR
jgi:putative phosphoesterase